MARLAVVGGELIQGQYPLMTSDGGQRPAREAFPAGIDEHFFRILSEHAGVGIAYTDRGGRLLWVNDFFCRLVGRGREAVEPMTHVELIHPDDRDATGDAIRRALGGEVGAQPMETRYLRADGSIRWGEVRLTPLVFDGGEVNGVAAAVVDITVRKAMEDALRATEERFEAQFRGMPLPTYTWRALDGDFVLIDYNGAADAATEGQIQRLVGSAASALYADHLDIYRALRECYSTHRPVSQETWYRMRSTGAERYLSIHYAYVPPDLVMISTKDLTDHQQAEAALREARDALEQRVRERTAELEHANAELKQQVADRQRAEARAVQRQAELAHVARLYLMGEMATGIAHELNQPLGAIRTYAGAALGLLERSGGDDLHEPLEQIQLQAVRAAEIIRRLRDFVSKREPVTASADINALVQDVVSFMDAPGVRLGATITVDAGAGLPLVLVDLVQIEQVLVNLLHNAMEAMAEAGCTRREIVVRTSVHDARSVRIEVEDSGPGMLPGELQGAFDAFVTSKKSGMGMGLAISRTIIESHGGRLWADSVPGAGARFMFTLPTA